MCRAMYLLSSPTPAAAPALLTHGSSSSRAVQLQPHAADDLRKLLHRLIGIRCQGPSNVTHLPNSTKHTVLSMHSRKECIMHDSFMGVLGLVLVAHCHEF